MHSTAAATPLDQFQIEEHLNIPYTSSRVHSPLHEFDLYVPTPPSASLDARKPPLICFIHGGAWRSEDKAHHAPLARRLAAHTRCPVAIPNYRLTTPSDPLRHPAHAEDALAFLHFLLAWPGPTHHLPDAHPPYDPAQLYLIGHSCSAHMLTSIFLQPPAPDHSSPPASPSPSTSPTDIDIDTLPPSPHPMPATLAPSPALLAATRALVLSSGIYDIDALLHTFPAYKSWFVAAAFGRLRSYAPWNTAAYALRAEAQRARGGLRWLIVHSTGDTLVDRAQSERIWGRLGELYGEAAEGGRMVERNWDSLTEEHNEALAGEVYPRIVGDFILDDAKWRETAL